MLRRIAHSLVTRLLLLGIMIAVAGAAVCYHAVTRFLREDLSNVIKGQQLALANYVAHDIDTRISERRSLIQHLAESFPADAANNPARVRTWLRGSDEAELLFTGGILVLRPDGKPLDSRPASVLQDAPDFNGSEYALPGLPLVGRPFVLSGADQAVLPISAPVRAHGKVVAVIVGLTPLMSPAFLEPVLHHRVGESGGGILVISPRDRIFVVASQPERMLQPTPPAGLNALHDRAMAGYRGTGITVNARGVEEISAIASVPSADWFVVARIPTVTVFSAITRTQDFLIRNTAWALMVFVALALTGLYFVLRPLFAAARHADEITRHGRFEALPAGRNDEIGHLIGAFNRLLNKLHEQQARLAYTAQHDPLTGLPNRALLSDRLDQALIRAHRRHTGVALMFMDLDGFKPINDQFGHDVGDQVLCQVAKRLQATVRQSDTLARVGGDEFVLVLSDLSDHAEDGLRQLAQKCIEVMAAPFEVAGISCKVGVSIGVALAVSSVTADRLMTCADQAMYRAKDAGRNTFEFRII